MNWISILAAGAMTQASGLSYALTPTGRSAISRAPVTRTGWLILLVLASPVWVPAATAQEPYCPPGETICVGFDGALDAALPLETATKVKVDKRREKEKASKKTTGACRNALEANDEDNIAKHCNKSPKREKSILRNKPIEVGGKQRGKSIKTRTKLSFEKPSQRYGNQNKKKWDKLVFKPPQTGDVIASSWRRQSNTNDKRRNKQFGVVAPVTNDDRDCVDSFTGEHKGGTGIADGDPASCFESGGVLKASLTPEGDGCRHENGTFFYGPWDEDGDGEPAENACWDADGNLKTTLVELIDEDGASSDNNPSDGGLFDIDGDGLDGEDPPNPDGYAVNDDQDCIDTVTGRHLRAAECFINGNLRQTLSTAYYGCENGDGEFLEEDPYDGIEDQCYDGSGAPQPSTTPLAEGCFHCLAEGCEFAGGATFFEGEYPPADEDNDGTIDENDCYFADGTLKNTLAELFDEDDGLAIDDDADGLFDEDGPDTPADFQQDCHNMAKRLADDDGFDTTGVYTNDGGCDLTRAIIVGANKASLVKNGKKVYKADNQGRFDDSVGGDATEYGYETRSLVIDEDFTVLCTDEEVFDDLTGQCIPETQESALQAYRATMSMAPAALDGSLKNYAMMGFTFAPPRVRWGLFYKEELDLYFFTITLFEAKIGYDFALGVGFRLPVEVEVSNLPLDSILAGQHLNPVSEVRPENFSVQQYKDFCTNNAMGNAAYCNRFAFPNALDSSDGDELAIRMTAFAGIKVVILEIPLINWGVDIDMDMPEMCSLYLAYENVEDVAMEMAYEGVGFADAMSSLNLNCGTYTTPYGNDEDGNPVQFPFIQNAPFVNQMIRADCAEAFARGETVKLPSGEVIPLCTGIILGVHGASLGLGVGTDLEMNSNLIKANASARGDSVFLEHQQNGYEQPLQFFAADEGGSEQVDIDTLRVDNYDDSDTEDFARVTLDDFTYCLNNFSIRLKGQAMFGGILTIFPDFPDFTIYRLTLPLGDSCGIPVGQHANTNPVEFPVLVENYGVEVFVETDPADPNRVDDKTLKYPPAKNQPGGDFLVLVKNIGSFPGGFDNFSYELSNQRDQNAPYAFVIDPDNDGDGLIDEDDFGPAGQLRDVRDEDGDGMADEDPPDDWQSTPPLIDFNIQTIEEVPPHTRSSDASIASLTLRITPFVHPSTSPGIYPFRVTADSSEAKLIGLATVDPSFNRRTGAHDVAFIKVESFYDPRIAVQPATPAAKPAVEVVYTFEGTNMGNSEDSMAIAVDFKDFNEDGCSLTDRGKLPGCPYRAERTVIDAETWTTLASLATGFGPLDPLGSDTDTLVIVAPGDWEGMVDTTYQYEVTATSLEDDDPPTRNSILVEHTVIATKESMTRYIRHEIVDLIAEIEAANEAGIKTGGLLPLSTKPALEKADKALQSILAGKLSSASNALSSNIKIMEAFVHALDGFNGKGTKFPMELDADWRARAAAIIEDLQVAEASEVTSG